MSEFDRFTQDEIRAVKELRKWAERCPRSLMVFGGSTLWVLHRSDWGKDVSEVGLAIAGVHCDGGVGDA